MATGLPWSVRGIDADIREQAVEAAHRSGLSVGQWLNQVLAGNLEDDDIDEDRPPPRRRRSDHRRFEALAERLQRVSTPRTATAAHRFRDAPEPRDSDRVFDLLETTIDAVERLHRESAHRTGGAASREDEGSELLLARVLQKIEAKLDPLTAQPAPRAIDSADTAARISGLDAKLAEILQRLNQTETPSFRASAPHAAFAVNPIARGFHDDDPAFTQAIAEIEAHRRSLDARDAERITAQRANAAPAAPVASPRHQDEPIDAIRRQLDLLVTRIDDMRTHQNPGHDAIKERFDQLAGQIDSWRAAPQDEVALIRRDLSVLASGIEALAPHRLVGMVEEAVAGIAEKSFRPHAEALPLRLIAPIEKLQEDVRDVLQEVKTSQHSTRISAEISQIVKRLDDIGQSAQDPARLQDILREVDTIKTLVQQALKAQPLDGLARQIEALGTKIETFKHDPQLFNDRPILDAIAAIRDQVDAINPRAVLGNIETRLSAIADIETRLGAMAGIEAKLGEIARNMSKLSKAKQPLPQLETIAARLERIDRVLDHSREQPLAGLDRIAERLEQIGSHLDRPPPPGETVDQQNLVALMQQLSQKFDRAQASPQDSPALDILQDEIARLTRHMEQSAPNHPALDGLEKSIQELFRQLELVRSDMRDAVKSVPREAGTDTLAAEGLLLIKRDLGDFKNAASESERRTRQTLEALNATLEALVGRLSVAEPRAHVGLTPPAAALSARPETPARPDSTRPLATSGQPAPDAKKLPVSAPAAPPIAAPSHKPAPFEDISLGDLPLEPGQRPGTSPPASPAATAPGAASALMENAVSADPKSNFIAAARRAALAAADRSQAALDEGESHKKTKTEGAGAPAPQKGSPASSTDALPHFIARTRKPILLGLAAIVFALGAIKMMPAFNTGLSDNIPAAVPKIGPNSSLELPASDSAGAARKGEVELPVPTDEPEPSAQSPEKTGSIGPLAMPPGIAIGKRVQRLSEMKPEAQMDPITVGSISNSGANKPIETGKQAIIDLVAQSSFKGVERLQQAVLSGNKAALFEVGARYMDGRGVTRDPALAARWFEQAAVIGHAPAQYRLASLYREGRGIPKDPALAFQWYDRAAAQGHILAMHNAAVLLAEGVHGAPDYAGAALWFKRAAEHGVKDSQFNVAILYARGLGLNQDLPEAFHWFAISAEAGDQDAAKKRDDIAARLTKEQLEKARTRLKAFAVQKSNPEANEPGSWDGQARVDPTRTKAPQTR